METVTGREISTPSSSYQSRYDHTCHRRMWATPLLTYQQKSCWPRSWNTSNSLLEFKPQHPTMIDCVNWSLQPSTLFHYSWKRKWSCSLWWNRSGTITTPFSPPKQHNTNTNPKNFTNQKLRWTPQARKYRKTCCPWSSGASPVRPFKDLSMDMTTLAIHANKSNQAPRICLVHSIHLPNQQDHG